MDSEIGKYIKVIEHISYILECVTQECTGEAKTELDNLCKHIEIYENYQFHSWHIVNDLLKDALAVYREGNYREAAVVLSRANRMIWKMFEEKDFFSETNTANFN